ncbi:MAG: HAMP domain-containing histidine kinase [Thermoleophilaceae bacterium]|nr:HAMP domain-containing histidine kinase [Thermoleophilaceae bacterium]
MIAIAVNYVMVVPRLDAQLKRDRIQAVANASRQSVAVFQNNVFPVPAGFYSNASPPVALTAGNASTSTGYRVRVLELDPQSGAGVPVSVGQYEDNTYTQKRQAVKDTVALAALRTGSFVSGVRYAGDRPVAESAFPLRFNNQQVTGVVIYSDSLSDVTSVVNRLSGRILVAGLIALFVALLVGTMAARTISRRLRRLETAALEISKGNFQQPLETDSSDELGELARAFNHMQDRLGRADRSRKAFIATASHELRTPLFSLGGYMELLRSEELDDETREEFLETMDNQIQRLQKLATDLLDVSRIDSGTLEVKPEPVNLVELVRAVANDFEPLALQHDSTITINAPDRLDAMCDPDRVAQMLRILLDNALSHTPSGTEIEVSLGQLPGQTQLAVADNGPGIPAETLPRIFDRFHSGDKSGGTGLGLSIARDLAAAMGGRLEVSALRDGTQFMLTLPNAETDAR